MLEIQTSGGPANLASPETSFADADTEDWRGEGTCLLSFQHPGGDFRIPSRELSHNLEMQLNRLREG